MSEGQILCVFTPGVGHGSCSEDYVVHGDNNTLRNIVPIYGEILSVLTKIDEINLRKRKTKKIYEGNKLPLEEDSHIQTNKIETC